MAQKALIVSSGKVSQIPNAESLIVGTGIDAATATTLTVGTSTATAITIGQASVTTTFPGPVQLNGTVTSVSQTTFTTDAVFQGNITFGDAATDNISFVGQIDTAITQEGIAAPAVSPASTGRIYFDSTSNKFRVSQNGGAYADLATGGTVTSVTGSGGTTGLTLSGGPITTSGTLTLGGTLVAANGGTGQSSYTSGDLLYASAATTLSKLALGAANTVLRSNGTAPAWGSVVLSTDVSGTLPIANGGTGQTTAAAAFGALSPLTTKGDLLGFNTANARIPVGTDGQVLTADSAQTLGVKWATPTTGTVTSVSGSGGTTGLTLTGGPITTTGTLTLGGTLAVANGGTGQTTYTDGQLLIGNSTGNTLTKATLTAGSGVSITNGSGSITISATGSGGTVTSVNVSGGTTGLTTSGGPVTGSGTITLAGTLVAANGGTGFSSYAVGDLLFANTTTTLAKLADVATGNALISGGVGVAPSWGKIGLTTHVSGTLPVGNGGTGITTTPTNGQIPIGNGTTYTAATLSAGTGISITNGSGSITIAATGAASSTAIDLSTNANEALSAGNLVAYIYNTQSRVQKAEADGTGTRPTPAGFVTVAAASAGDATTLRVAGVVTVPTALFDVAPTTSDVGQPVYMSNTAGQVTLTAPSSAPSVAQKVGVLTDVSGSNALVLVQIGDPIVLV